MPRPLFRRPIIMSAPADSVALDALSGSAGEKSRGPAGAKHLINFKVLVAIFVLFVLVVSDVFTNNVVSGFGGAVKCRTPTSYGTVVQGIFLVIFYALAVNLIEGDII